MPAPLPDPISPQVSDSSDRFWALIPCAGIGSRAGGAGPKQYQPLLGTPLVLHTLAAMTQVSEVHQTLVVVAPGDHFLDSLALTFTVLPCGGDTRAQTVLNGLLALSQLGARDNDWVLVHDAARCLITPSQVQRLIDACRDDPVGGLLAIPLPDTLKQSTQGRVSHTLERADKWLAQTPQMFRLGRLRQALQSLGQVATDEASAIEAQGHSPLLVQGSAQNFKVTYPEDFALAEAVLQSRLRQDPTT